LRLFLEYIAEFARVTKPGGVMVFQFPDRRQDDADRGDPAQEDFPAEFWDVAEPYDAHVWDAAR
jgi:hypothetical protein